MKIINPNKEIENSDTTVRNMSLSTLVLPPQFREGYYESFKKEVEIWQLLKTCQAKEQGPILFRSFSPGSRAQKAALELNVNDIIYT